MALFMGIAFSSCSKNSNLEPVSPKPQLSVNPLMWSDVQTDLNNMGAVTSTQPTGWTPAFTGYNSVHFYYLASSNTSIDVYVFDEGSTGYVQSGGDCQYKWNSNDGACTGEGHDCKTVQDPNSGKWHVVCCD
jgi:hypothetical protein